jgi:hypothetical protein
MKKPFIILSVRDRKGQTCFLKDSHTAKARLSGNSSIGKVALAPYFHRVIFFYFGVV